MHLLQWVDNRTLVMCLCLLAAVFTTALLGIRHVYPRLRGVGTMAFGFFLGIPTTLLLSVIARAGTIVTAIDAFCACFCYIFLYLGILRFLGRRGHLRILGTVAGAAIATVLYVIMVSHKIVPAIVGISSTMGLAQALIAKELFRYARKRAYIRLFAISMVLFSSLNLLRCVLTILRGAPNDYMRNNGVQTLGLVIGVVFVCVEGILCLALVIGEVNREFAEQAQLDYVTGTLNRRGIEEAMIMELARSRRSERPISILLIDVDRFKAINDLYGHAMGDEALRTVARSIVPALRVYDKLGRYGGDEFLLLLPETMEDNAMIIAGRIRDALSLQAREAGIGHLTASIGVTSCAPHEELIEILGRADAALYEAKRAGRDCSRLHRRPHSAGTALGKTARRRTLMDRVSGGRKVFGFFFF
jgi:diguanylate cyclase (GGDEF)-like protein